LSTVSSRRPASCRSNPPDPDPSPETLPRLPQPLRPPRPNEGREEEEG
jgi:hypothetical protein